eukprot:SAG11_NODE_9862_length_874_cov_1.829677_1_plen_44_part_01
MTIMINNSDRVICLSSHPARLAAHWRVNYLKPGDVQRQIPFSNS